MRNCIRHSYQPILEVEKARCYELEKIFSIEGHTWSPIQSFSKEWDYKYVPEPQDRLDYVFYSGESQANCDNLKFLTSFSSTRNARLCGRGLSGFPWCSNHRTSTHFSIKVKLHLMRKRSQVDYLNRPKREFARKESSQ